MSINPTRLLPIPNPDTMIVNYDGTDIGHVIREDDHWVYRGHGEAVPATETYTEAQDAGNALTERYMEQQVTMLTDISDVVGTFLQTLLDQPQPSNLEITSHARRLRAALAQRIDTLTDQLPTEEEDEG